MRKLFFTPALRSTRVFVCSLIMPLTVFFSCAGSGKAVQEEEVPSESYGSSTPREISLLPPPEIISPLYQTAKYNGKSLPFIVLLEGDAEAPLEVYYYLSKRERQFDEGGKTEAPVNAGVYYVKIKRPTGNGYGKGKDLNGEYRIQKSEVKITAGEAQSARYNGDPKRVTASSIPPVPLSFSYYPSAQVRQAALDALARKDEASINAASTILSGLKRVESAPIEQGVYYVIVYYPGDENYDLSYMEVEFTIAPPEKRRR